MGTECFRQRYRDIPKNSLSKTLEKFLLPGKARTLVNVMTVIFCIKHVETFYDRHTGPNYSDF